MAEQSLSEVMRHQAFAMCPLQPDGLLLSALGAGRLQPRDAVTLWAVLHHLDWRSGRCWASVEELAAATFCRPQVLEQSLARLLREELVTRSYDATRLHLQFLCLNPIEVATTGGSYRRQLQRAQFERGLEAERSGFFTRSPGRADGRKSQAAAGRGSLLPSAA